MTVASIATLVLLALTLAAQPWSVLAGIILVTTKRGVAKEIAYVIGWVTALSIVAALTVAFAPVTPSSVKTATSAWIEVGLGVLLLIVLAVRWRRGPVTDKAASPKWIDKLDAMPVLLAAALGAFLPNYIVVVAAVNEMIQSKLTGASLTAAAVAFVLIASIGVAAPLAVLVFRHAHAQDIYTSWRVWILGHSRAVSYITGAAICAVLVVKGLVTLATLS